MLSIFIIKIQLCPDNYLLSLNNIVKLLRIKISFNEKSIYKDRFDDHPELANDTKFAGAKQ